MVENIVLLGQIRRLSGVECDGDGIMINSNMDVSNPLESQIYVNMQQKNLV